jgi:hypothetical protein
LIVVDADHIIHADREAVRAELASFGPEVEVITAPYRVPLNDSRPLNESAATNWHKDIAGKTEQHRLMFRPFGDMKVEMRHWWYSGTRNGDRVWFLHTDTSGEGLPAHSLRSRYEVEHVCLFRDERRILAGRAFCADRVMVVEKTGQEDDVPGLSPPVFDFVSIPL